MGMSGFHGAKRLSALLPCLFTAAILALPACKKPVPLPLPPVKKAKQPSFPIECSLMDPKNGTSIPVKITGRSDTHVDFIRLKDVKFFSYSIDKLAPEDQKFVRGLPLVATDPSFMPKKEEPPYIKNRLDQITKLEKEISILKLQAKKEVENPGMARQYKRRISDMTTEISGLRADIEIYRLNH